MRLDEVVALGDDVPVHNGLHAASSMSQGAGKK
jgi:hypothetical protein